LEKYITSIFWVEETRRRESSVLFQLFLDPEDGGDMFLRNVSWLSMDYMALYLGI
jgi:hypothetical protein